MQISEQVVVLGQNNSLVGIFAQPVGAAERGGNIAVVILNTGIIHRVGFNRMYVTISRALARAGYPVVRFDLSGIGDSDKRNDDLAPLQSMLSDLKEVIDWLQASKSINRVVLMGLCLGADHAAVYAATDPRVAGVVIMDPSMPPTLRYFRDYLRNRLLNPRSWFNVLFGRSRLRSIFKERVMGALSKDWEPENPMMSHPKLRAQLEEIYSASADRGVKFLAVFTEGGAQTYPEQLAELLPNVNFSNLLQTEFFRDGGHTFASEASRTRLQQRVLEWIGETAF